MNTCNLCILVVLKDGTNMLFFLKNYSTFDLLFWQREAASEFSKGTSSLFFSLLFNFIFFFLRLVTCRILVPWPGIKSWPPALGAWSLNYWTTGEVLGLPHFNSFYPHKPWDQSRGYTIKWVYSNYLGTTKMDTRWIHGPSGPIVSQTLPRLNIYFMTPAIVGGMMKL